MSRTISFTNEELLELYALVEYHRDSMDKGYSGAKVVESIYSKVCSQTEMIKREHK